MSGGMMGEDGGSWYLEQGGKEERGMEAINMELQYVKSFSLYSELMMNVYAKQPQILVVAGDENKNMLA
ncbi:unnamed protein product [Linum trigynum]|uniref:Uncharacterized protein n=1 Tax=Linum trigynum TaxID=586398 RepID=A0AAV2D7R1_9ROSI